MDHQILYVDDERDNLDTFKAVFRRQYQIQLAESGAEALELLKKHPISLLITDQRMPKMTGVELLEEIREEYPDIIRMVMTGYSDMQAIIDAINKGKVYHFVTKPWKAEELKVILDHALETYTLRMANRKLEKENVLAQFQVLKNQINPHFLFNSMNVLSSLIRSNPDVAVNFAGKFSKLYRSVLELREQLLISLKEELDFVDAYYFLQKMRFEDVLALRLDIPKEKYDMSLPPFALQILVENVVKHNIISADQPLEIVIRTEGDHLIVENTLQVRKVVEESTGTGLTNLEARYALIGNLVPRFYEEGGKFIAKIPLVGDA